MFRYVAEGAREEITLGEAEASWRAIRIAPHILRDVLHVETSTRLLGTTFDLPLGIASTGANWWLQLYVPEAREEAAPLLEAAVAAGAAAVVLTADAPVLGTRYRSPEGPHVWEMADASWVGANVATVGVQPQDRAKALDLGPADIAWLASATGLPVVVKGVLRSDDAAACVAAGASAVWVSNHGGRQLDQAVATAGCVAAVRGAVGEKAQVDVDGGVRSGLHALLGVSLRADAVFVGRPMFHALAAGGSDGVVRALAELGSELVETMRLCGASTLGQTRGIASTDRGCGPEAACHGRRTASDLREESL